MNKFLSYVRSILGVLVGASLIAGSAHSGVVYSFTADSSLSGPTGAFTYTAPSLISTNTFLNVVDLDSCTSSIGVCTSPEVLIPDYLGYSAIHFSPSEGKWLVYYFFHGVFTEFGTFNSVLLGPQQHATLTISSEASSVPEPESLALFGIALAGLGLTRRKAMQV